MITKKDILSRSKSVKLVPLISEWGDDLFIRPMSGGDYVRIMIEQHVANKAGKPTNDFAAKVIIASVAGKDGKLIFSNSDLQEVLDLPHSELDVVYDQCAVVNKINRVDEKKD